MSDCCAQLEPPLVDAYDLGKMPLTESDFWASLEYRICAEVAGASDRQLRGYWCDGLVAGESFLQGRRPRITGCAWFGATGQEEWTFTLFLRRRHASRDAIDWAALLPPADVTGWLAIDVAKKHLTMDPTAAVPDKSAKSRAPQRKGNGPER